MDLEKFKYIQEKGWFNEFVSADAELAWSIFRTQLAVVGFDGLVFVLPRLSDQSFYRPYFVLLKNRRRTLKQLLFAEPACYQPAGQLLTLITEITRDSYESMITDIQVDRSWRCCTLKRKYQDERNGVEKRITVTLADVKKLKCPPLKPSTIRVCTETLAAMLNGEDEKAKDAEKPKTLLVIQAVYLAENVKMELKCGSESTLWTKKDVVVGFETWRYDVTSDGRLGASAPYIRPHKIKTNYWRSAMEVDWPEVKHQAEIVDVDFLPESKDDATEDSSTEKEDDNDRERN